VLGEASELTRSLVDATPGGCRRACRGLPAYGFDLSEEIGGKVIAEANLRLRIDADFTRGRHERKQDRWPCCGQLRPREDDGASDRRAWTSFVSAFTVEVGVMGPRAYSTGYLELSLS
jgi:hypothetical protein